jgi:predicted methyltransferase
MEIWPGGGWYTEILAPVLRERGRLVIAGWDPEVPDQPDYRYRLQAAILEKFAETPDIYDRVGVAGWSPPQSASLGEADSIDMILTFRNVHGWIGEGLAETAFAEFARVLKPGGVLGVVQHRAATAGSGAAERGYVSEATVIGLAAQAGLFLEAKSEVNANPKDTGEHDPGVWALPPSLAKCREFESPDEFDACAAPYRKIGESDRMTLKFRKPAG